MNKLKIRPSIECENEEGTKNYFTIGDKVVCRTTDREIVGIIRDVTLTTDDAGEENVLVLVLNTSVSRWSISYEIVRLDEIDVLYKQKPKTANNTLLTWYQCRQDGLDEEQEQEEKVEKKPCSLIEPMIGAYGRDENYRNGLMDNLLGISKIGRASCRERV